MVLLSATTPSFISLSPLIYTFACEKQYALLK